MHARHGDDRDDGGDPHLDENEKDDDMTLSLETLFEKNKK